MSKTYAQIIKQIESLKSEAEKLKRKEVDGVIARIKEAISAYGLTAGDLGLANGRAARGPARGKTPKAAAKRGKGRAGAAAKFRDESGNTWGGRGPRPRWLREALAGGKKLEDFAV